MKRTRATTSTSGRPGRILFFDLLRISFVALIVYGHSQFVFLPWLNSVLFMDGYTPLAIYPLGLTGLSVYGMILVSGAVLEYNYKGLERSADYGKFVLRRVIRLYPAFWMSLILGILLFPVELSAGIFNVLMEFTGFYIILGKGAGMINGMGWFIATIMSLYLVFPWVSKLIKQHPAASMLGFLATSFFCRYLFISTNIVPIDLLYKWFPLCNLFEFALGIFLVQNALYPRNTTDHPWIREIAELSFYVFLFHWIVTNVFGIYTVHNLQLFYLCQILGLRLPEFLMYLINYSVLMGSILLVSWIAMKLDIRVQQRIRSCEWVKTYLGS